MSVSILRNTNSKAILIFAAQSSFSKTWSSFSFTRLESSVQSWISCCVHFPAQYLLKCVDGHSIHLVADHYRPRFPRFFFSNQQHNHYFYLALNSDFSGDVVETNHIIRIFSRTIHTLLTLGWMYVLLAHT